MTTKNPFDLPWWFSSVAALMLVIPITILAWCLWQLGSEKQIETTTTWCEVGTVNEDGTISYSGPSGSDEIVVLATVNGPKIISQNCK